MPEICLTCGRTYPDACAYDDHPCIEPADIARAAATHECHEEVTRRGMTEPCDFAAVGVRIDPNENAPYPVCKRHVRGAMVPLPSVAESAWTASKPNGRVS